MALRTVIYLPDPRLRLPTKAITTFDDELKTLINEMYETMYHENGIGLAAPQIGLSLKLAVIDVSEKRNEKPTAKNRDLCHAMFAFPFPADGNTP